MIDRGSEYIWYAAYPGPLYWDFRCLACGEATTLHAPWWKRWLNRKAFT